MSKLAGQRDGLSEQIDKCEYFIWPTHLFMVFTELSGRIEQSNAAFCTDDMKDVTLSKRAKNRSGIIESTMR